MDKAAIGSVKAQLHSRNRHRLGYDFLQLAQTLPELAPFIYENQYGNLSVDFSNPIAVKMLNKALLLHFYKLIYWDIPDSYLCPPVPGRADYIHYLADLLADENHGLIPQSKPIRVLDIGVGANAIYPIVGHGEYGWSFVGSDINPAAIKIATLIAQSNPKLKDALQCRLQPDNNAIFNNIIKAKEYFALTLCNPPFYASAQEAQASNYKKVTNLAKSTSSASYRPTIRNFSGQDNELWCQGGESEFISKMIIESKDYQSQCLWFSSLVAKKETLTILTKLLNKVGVADFKIINMAQGQKISRMIAWTFIDKSERHQYLRNHSMI
ncbi:23S rRNA (adenine(1618)-N(6))-methyltransferase RlmF [Orbus sturtevantii]|uniref:23S rRNA (adenine(1618)-N(6))-methyltransferase RlmF n=1 Tax=Orbus sturtevantii TaxID=3074109 RepID=UPI00370D6900